MTAAMNNMHNNLQYRTIAYVHLRHHKPGYIKWSALKPFVDKRQQFIWIEYSVGVCEQCLK